MKTIIKCAMYASFAIISTGALADDNSHAAALMETNCLSCHGSSGEPSTRVAPPMAAVKAHYLKAYSTKNDFINAIVRWVREPAETRTHMPGAIRRFGLMPALPYPEADLKLIAEFIYEEALEKPGWFEEHYKQEHGSD